MCINQLFGGDAMKVVPLPRFENFYSTNCCLHDCLATICNQHGMDVNVIYHEYMLVKYDKIDENVSCQNLKLSLNPQTRMEVILGIEMKNVIFNENIIEEFLNLIDQNNCHIIVLLDPYYCPWDYVYHLSKYKNEYRHYFIIDGYNSESNEFICIDPFYNRQDVTISFEEFLMGYLSHFEIKKIEKLTSESSYISIEEQMDYYKDLFTFFNDYFNANLNQLYTDKECLVELHNLLMTLKERCYYFATYLLYLDKKKKLRNYCVLHDLLKSIFNEWAMIDSLVLKHYVSDTNSLPINDIKLKIDNVIDNERQFMLSLNSLLLF